MKFNDRDLIVEMTSEWKGERFPDGRPRVSDDLLRRVRAITTEEAWVPMAKAGYKLQYEGDLRATHGGNLLVGRAVTAVFVPSRPDVHMIMLEHGRAEEKRKGFFNQWVVDSLVEDDVLVVDMCDQIVYGTYVGGNLSTAIKSRTKRGGAVIWGGIRDLQQIVKIPDFQVYYRGIHPSPIGDVMMTGMNVPCRIGKAVCMPGDVVLGTISGVTFIPAHMVEDIVVRAEKSHVRDAFGFERLNSGVYTSAQIDQDVWGEEMMRDFMAWFAVSEAAKGYQHLNWDGELALSRQPRDAAAVFNGTVVYDWK